MEAFIVLLFVVAVVVGLVVLLWGADRFIEGSASVARHLGMPPLLIGMVVGIPALRLKGIYLALVTLVFTEAVRAFFERYPPGSKAASSR